MASTRGSSVGYQDVEELIGSNGSNGKNIYAFTTSEDYPDIVDNAFPFTPNTDFDVKRGFEKNVKVQRNNGSNSFTTINETKNQENYTPSKSLFAVFCLHFVVSYFHGSVPLRWFLRLLAG